MRAVRRIVHPSDFSPASRPAFRKAVELARTYRAQLLVVHVLPMLPVIPDAYVPPSIWADLERGQRSTAQRQLGRLVARAKAAGVRASGALLDLGVTHEQIVRFARARRADLIVMGTHGRSGLTKALLGSVASRVLTTSRCPVVTVRA
jgi:nucleotide-binding universal stress UspA family protein